MEEAPPERHSGTENSPREYFIAKIAHTNSPAGGLVEKYQPRIDGRHCRLSKIKQRESEALCLTGRGDC